MRRGYLIGLIGAGLLFLTAARGEAISLGTAALETVAVGAAVKATAKPVNSAINTLTFNRKLPAGTATKVVPVLSFGNKAYVGAAQVAGAGPLVARTKSVLQFETEFDQGRIRIRFLAPMDSTNPLKLHRVKGLGVSALADIALSRHAYRAPVHGPIHLGDVIFAGAIGVGVNEFGPQINSFINGFAKNEGAPAWGSTKVVPYLSSGERAYIGAMQVAGPAAAVAQVKAVWQYEDLFDLGRIRLRALVPTNSINPLKMKRVGGVGCTAVIDFTAIRSRERARFPDHYRYHSNYAFFLGEDPRYRPPGWTHGRKTGWILHGTPTMPPGLAKKLAPPGAVIVVPRVEVKPPKPEKKPVILFPGIEKEKEKRGQAPPAKGKGRKGKPWKGEGGE